MDDVSEPEPGPSLSDARDTAIAVYNGGKVGVGAYVGGPLVATYMLSRNFAALGYRGQANRTLLIGGAGSIALFLVIMLVIPQAIMDRVPNMVIPLLYTGAAVAMFKSWQASEIDAHLVADGKAASGWRVAGVSLLGLLVTGALIFGVAMAAPTMDGERVTVGAMEHEVFYEPPVTEAEALRVGEVLNELLFVYVDFATYVKVERSDTGYTVFFPVQDGTWDDPQSVADYLGMRPALSAALSGANVSIVLMYESLRGREDHPI